MDLRAVILQRHTRAHALQIADYVSNNSIRFKVLVKVFLNGPYRVTQRAAWPLSFCVEKHPHLIIPHLKEILYILTSVDVHNAAKRNILRLLQFIEIPEKYFPGLIESCFKFLENKKEPVAIHVFSMAILSKTLDHYPELQKDLKIILEDRLPYASPGFRSRAIKVLRKIDGRNFKKPEVS